MSEEAVSVFLSYSRSDLEMLNRLNKQLASLIRTKKIKTWHDRDIEAGSEWEPEIQNRLNTADIIILLISADFMASEYCYSNELKRAIERHDKREARVIPVILKPCLWNLPGIPFSKLNVLPDHARPITRWEDPEEAFAAVALHISNLVENLRQRKKEQEAEQQRQESERQRQAEAQERQQLLAQKEAEESAEREQIQREQRQAEAQERQRQDAEKERQAEQLRQRQAAEAARKQQQESAKQPPPDAPKENYAQLEVLLKAGKWKEADQETAKKMCEVMGRQEEGWLRVEDIEQFPCTDLRTIDQLWVKYSKGKFGFSVQKKIWLQCGSPTEYNKQWEQFGVEVGWRSKGIMGLGIGSDWNSYNDVTFDTSAPDGHLPFLGIYRVVGGRGGWVCCFSWTLFSLGKICGL